MENNLIDISQAIHFKWEKNPGHATTQKVDFKRGKDVVNATCPLPHAYAVYILNKWHH